MLDRIRGMVQRLELPQEEQEEVIYRILDDDGKVIEVSPAQYGIWRMQHNVAQLAVVGQSTVGNIVVKTTFSIMPENRSYKPFGTHAYELPDFDPLNEYSARYDTREEAEQGHRSTQERIRRELARAILFDEKVEAMSGTAGQVRLAITVDLPAMFEVDFPQGVEDTGGDVIVTTPMLCADGSPVALTVSHSGGVYLLTGVLTAANGPQGLEGLDPVCRLLGLTIESEKLVVRVADVSQLGDAMVRLAQGVACVSMANLLQG